MNKFVVFAILAACALAESMFPTLENHHRNVRDDDVELDPHPLPCSYEIMFHQKASAYIGGEWVNYGNASGTYFKHSTYFKVFAVGHSLNHTHTIIEQLYRNDIKDKSGNCIAFLANRTGEDSECNTETMTEKEMAERVNQTLELFITKTKYQKKEDGKFGEIDCTLYINEDEEDKSVSTIFVDKDNYIIGANYTKYFDFAPGSGSESGSASGSTNGLLIQMIATVTYRHYALARSFVIIHNVTDQCPDEAYVAPEQPLCFVEYIPPTPTCAFEIHMKQKSTVNGTEVGSAESDAYVHKTFVKLRRHIMMKNEPETTREIVFRPDIMVDGNVTVFASLADSNESYCENGTISPKEMAEVVYSEIFYFVNTTKHEYETTYEYQGKTYKAFVDYMEPMFGEGSITFVVDESNYLVFIAMEMPSHRLGEYKAFVTIEHKDYTPVSSFVIDKNIGSNCTEEAYTAPAVELCPVPTPSSGAGSGSGSAGSNTTSSTSMASTSTVAVAMTLLSVALIALL